MRSAEKSRPERRKHERHTAGFPMILAWEHVHTQPGHDDDSRSFARQTTINISDGGALVPVPLGAVPRMDDEIAVRFCVPRGGSHSYMMEDICCHARVVRHEPLSDENLVAVALEFQPVQSLRLAR
jgi:hypothetical protein